MSARSPTFDDVRAAAKRLDGVARRTPLIAWTTLDTPARRVFVKVEALQRTGSFKFRGAYNRLVQLSTAERARGVVAFSSGNHAQGVAAAAGMLGVAATIVMPRDAPALKIVNTRTLGAEIVLYDRETESREAIAAVLANERGATLVPSFDDPDIIGGQGTVGLEMIEQARALGVTLDSVYVCVGGGGLIAGCALAFEALSPATRVYAVEPAGFDDTARSLAAGHRVANAPGERSFCDALLTPEPGELTFAINQRLLAGGIVVTDAEVARAVAFAFRELKVVLEPGGAVALAAALEGRVEGEAFGIVCSGGNVEADTFARCLA